MVLLVVIAAAGFVSGRAAAQPTPGPPDREPIRQVHLPADSTGIPVRLGERVHVAGRASADPAHVGPPNRVFIQQDGHGIAVDLPAPDAAIDRGDRLVVVGTLRHRYGLPFLRAERYTVNDEPVPVQPLVTSLDSIRRERYEGLLVHVHGRIMRGGSNNGDTYLLVQSAPGREALAVFVENRHVDRIPLDAYEPGDEVEVTGIVAQHDFTAPFTSYYELLPRTDADVKQARIPARYYRNIALLIGALILLGVIVIVALRREVRRQTRQLADSQKRFRRLAEATFEGVLIHQNGEIVDINQVLTDMTGYDREEVVGRDAREFLTEATRDLVEDHIDHPYEGPYEAVVVRRDGSTFPAEIESKTVERAGSAMRIVAIRNITQRKEDEAELLLAKEKAEQMARLKSSLLNNMSHELRTPITGIIGHAELIMNEPPETHEAFARHIHKSGKRLSDTLQSVLDMAQIEAGTLDPTLQQTDVRAIAENVVSTHRPAASDKDLTLSVACDGDPHLVTDRTVMYRILNNLVHNAIKFTPDGSVEVGLRAYRAGMHITVRDTGIGIDKEFQTRVFKPFQQESNGRTRSYEGTGLGLAITKHMVDLLGGSIRVDSTKGEGSTFRVDVPRPDAADGVHDTDRARDADRAPDADPAQDADRAPDTPVAGEGDRERRA